MCCWRGICRAGTVTPTAASWGVASSNFSGRMRKRCMPCAASCCTRRAGMRILPPAWSVPYVFCVLRWRPSAPNFMRARNLLPPVDGSFYDRRNGAPVCPLEPAALGCPGHRGPGRRGAPVGMPAAPDGEPFACGKDSGRGFPADVSDGNIRPHRQRTLGALAGQASAAFLQSDGSGLFYRPVVPYTLGMRRGVFRRADGERPGADYPHASRRLSLRRVLRLLCGARAFIDFRPLSSRRLGMARASVG